MTNPLAKLKSRLFRPKELPTGSLFALGTPDGTPADECLWRVCRVRDLRGLPHALIEQAATGLTKTVAVSAILSDRTFHVVQPTAS
jgi:hypothetical protein